MAQDGTWIAEDGKERCAWLRHDDPAGVAYHDTVWGSPTHDVAALFESLTLGVFEVGLNWELVFHKRDAFREAFAGFDPAAVAGFGPADVDRLVADAAIIRNHRKIEATIGNAKATVALDPDLAELSWSFAPRAHSAPRSLADVPSHTAEAEKLSAALKDHGFTFVGPTSVYAYMQSAGIVNDHLRGCFRAQPD